MIRLALTLAYDGTGFKGWASQPGLRCVQSTLETALALILRTPVSLTVAGRTDAGVHAQGQVAHFDIPEQNLQTLRAQIESRSAKKKLYANERGEKELREESGEKTGEENGVESKVDLDNIGQIHLPPELSSVLLRRLNTVLSRSDLAGDENGGADIVVYDLREVPPEFDARFSALSRSYRYLISDCPSTRLPVERKQVWWCGQTLDLPLLEAGAQILLGEHDFAAFCKAREGATTIRTLQSLDFFSTPGRIEVALRADAFCHSMVRSLVGALSVVASGRRPLSWLQSLLSSPARVAEVPVAPAHGLTLSRVEYPPLNSQALRRQQELTRRVRSL